MAIKGPAKQANTNQGQALSPGSARSQSAGKLAVPLVDNRPEAVVQRRLQELAKDNPGVVRLNALQKMADNNPDVARLNTLQAMVNTNPGVARLNTLQKMANNSAGLPDPLKQGIEHLSGIPMDDVRVHRNSDRPAQLKALAYAQGTDIHLGPGQEKHLPHEAWHVVQQKQGRVKPTLQAKGQINLNDDAGLEKEADLMGAKAMAVKPMPLQEHQGFSAVRTTTDTMQLKVQGADGEILADFRGLLGALGEERDVHGNLYTDKLLKRRNQKTTHVHKTTSVEKLERAKGGLEASERENLQSSFDEVNKNNTEISSKLGRLIDPSYAQTFTIQMLKDYLDGKKVPGMTLLGEGDILKHNTDPEEILASGTAAEKSLARVNKLKQTIERLNQNRRDQSASEETVDIGDDGVEQYRDRSTQRIAEHFRNTVWHYGTTGLKNRPDMQNVLAKAAAWAGRHKLRTGGDAEQTYNPGPRGIHYLREMDGEGGKNQQMMDMYYGGQQYEAWQTMRDPIIGEYIHRMMGYEGKYNQAESPDTTFRKNFPLGADTSIWKDRWLNRGWSENSKRNANPELKQAATQAGIPADWTEDKSATMEISRIVREGLKKYGGTLVFEGNQVFWSGVFVQGVDSSDTDVEAKAILPLFAKTPGASRVPIGKGFYVFHWKGKECAPRRRYFLSLWRSYDGRSKLTGGIEVGESGMHEEGGPCVSYKDIEVGEDGKPKKTRKLDRPDSWFWDFPY